MGDGGEDGQDDSDIFDDEDSDAEITEHSKGHRYFYR
jgi:hypothetical protein